MDNDSNLSPKAVHAARQDQPVKLTAPTVSCRRISAKEVCYVCGGISSMTLWRWISNPDLNFPKPIYIARRRFWREADIAAWLDSQAD